MPAMLSHSPLWLNNKDVSYHKTASKQGKTGEH
jgi:hypothetical protein